MMTTKRLKLSFSIEQILGLEDHATGDTGGGGGGVPPASSPSCTTTTSISSLTEERRGDDADYLHSPGSDGVYEYHEEGMSR